MYAASDLRKGLKIEIDGVPFVITEFSFNKPGKGQAIYSCKMRSLLTGTTLTKQYRSNDKIDKPELYQKTLQFSYVEGESYVFMDENYEQVFVSAELLGQNRFFLTEDLDVELLFHNGQAIEVTLPNFIEKTVIKTEPGAKGDTATNTLKPGVVEGGYELQIPLFVNEGDRIRIDTRTGVYADRILKG